jgi:hypothetical protein
VATGLLLVLTADCKARNAPRFASPSAWKLTTPLGLSNRPFGPSLEAAGKRSPRRKTGLNGLSPASSRPDAPYNQTAQ